MDNSVVAFVPARCGSKSIKLKNIRDFCGKPLIFWCLKALEGAKNVDQIFVATDCDEIAETVESFKFSKVSIFRRNAENAGDTASTEAVMLEFIQKMQLPGDNLFLLAQATSPFTRAEDFRKAIDQYYGSDCDSLLTCVRLKRFIWNAAGKSINYDYRNRPRRQDFDGFLLENGAFYINTVSNIRQFRNRLAGKVGIYEMPEYTMTELDEEQDWIVGEQIMKKLLPEQTKTVPKIKLFLSDIDGVLTDAGMYYSESGDELKKFSAYDGMGFEILRNHQIKTGLITKENRLLNEARAKKIKVDFFYQGIENKLETAREICRSLDIDLAEVAYIGDDINDLELLKAVGLAACPANAMKRVKDIEGIIQLPARGGEGAVREFVELIIAGTHD